MSQRDSGYKRKRYDAYQTPDWVTDVLCRHLRRVDYVWEPAAGKGQMVHALRNNGIKVIASDLISGQDFITVVPGEVPVPAIITNPPFGKAEAFIRRALMWTEPSGLVAMLTNIDFDSASTRIDLFRDHPAFYAKIVLLRRIVWFQRKDAHPSSNHCWLIWDWRHKGQPTIIYDQGVSLVKKIRHDRKNRKPTK